MVKCNQLTHLPFKALMPWTYRQAENIMPTAHDSGVGIVMYKNCTVTKIAHSKITITLAGAHLQKNLKKFPKFCLSSS